MNQYEEPRQGTSRGTKTENQDREYVTASMHDVQVTGGLLHPLFGLSQTLCVMQRRYVGWCALYLDCCILYVGYYSLYA